MGGGLPEGEERGWKEEGASQTTRALKGWWGYFYAPGLPADVRKFFAPPVYLASLSQWEGGSSGRPQRPLRGLGLAVPSRGSNGPFLGLLVGAARECARLLLGVGSRGAPSSDRPRPRP